MMCYKHKGIGCQREEKKNETYTCTICTYVINGNIPGTIHYIQCNDWVHRKFSGFTNSVSPLLSLSICELFL